MRRIFVTVILGLIFCLFPESILGASDLIYSNINYGMFDAPIGFYEDDEVIDFGSSNGGKVCKFVFQYASGGTFEDVMVRFYKNTNTQSRGDLFKIFWLNLPPTSGHVRTYEYVLPKAQQFVLPAGNFGYSFEFTTSGSYAIMQAWGGQGNLNAVWAQDYWGDWGLYTIPGSYAGFYMQLYLPIDEITCDIKGYKFNDLDGDGEWDTGEPTMPGWEVYLDLNNNGQKDVGEPNSVTNDPNGMYVFENLDSPAVYTVREIMKSGWTQTLPGSPNYKYVLNTEPNEVYRGYHFGNTTQVQPVDITVSGYVRDNGSPLENVEIQAYENGTTPIGTPVLSDPQGYYQIDLPSPWNGNLLVHKPGYLFNDPVTYANRTTDAIEDFDGTFLYGGGQGTEGAPFVILTAQQMNNIGRQPLDWDRHFILMADIDMRPYTGTAYNIIGSASNHFSGSFNGNHHVIRNFTYITSETMNYVGLFGYAQNAQIFNLGLENVILSTGGGSQYVGGLVGYQYLGSIQQCYVTGSVGCMAVGQYFGGLAGCLHGMTAVNCRSDVNVSIILLGGNYIGGLAGMAPNLTNCYSVGKVTANDGGMYVGGLVGAAPVGAIVSSYWDTETSGQSTGGGTPKTTEEMQTMSTYVSWDFDTVWRICDGTNYPRLQWEEKCIADFVCPDGVEWNDLNTLVDEWLAEKQVADMAPDGGDGFVDLIDWQHLAAAWMTEQGSAHWNEACDIAPDGGDNVVDLLDAAAIADSWLSPSMRFCDIAPAPMGDSRVDLQDFAVFAVYWMQDSGL